MPVLGLGHDVVDVAAFAEQLALPGSRMRALFSVRETRQAAARAAAKHDGEAVHLAAKWAGKEAVLKAWCEAVGEEPLPYTIDDFPWPGVEILDDAHGRPHVALRADVERALRTSLPPSSTRPPQAGSPSSEPIGEEVSSSVRSSLARASSSDSTGASSSRPLKLGESSANPSGGTQSSTLFRSLKPKGPLAAPTAGETDAPEPSPSSAHIWHISLTHDAGIASAVALLESD